MSELDKDLFAPPSKAELKQADEAMFSAPTEEEKQALINFIKPSDVSDLESAGAGFAKGGTFGFAPRIGAAGGALAEKGAGLLNLGPQAGNKAAGLPEQSLSDLYNEYLKYNKEYEEKAHKANPAIFNTAEFAGALASPLNRIATVGYLGAAGADASMLAKMAHGASAGAKVGAVSGLSQSPDLTNIKQDIEHAGQGAGLGLGVGAALPPVISGIQGAGELTGKGLKYAFGPVGQMFKKGAEAAVEGTPNLASEAGQIEAQQIRKEFANKFVDDLKNILKSSAKDKRQLIQNATEDVSPEQLDPILQKYLEANPKLNTPKSMAELQELKDMILTAKEGPLKTETVRQYVPGAKPEVPSNVQKITSDEPNLDLPLSVNEAPPSETSIPTNKLLSSESIPEEPLVNAAESKASTPGFSGYEPVHRATVDATDAEARQAFQDKVQEKLLDERILGKNTNSNPIKFEEHPIHGTDKVRLVAKRAITEEPADEFAEQASNLSQKQKEQDRLQKLLDKQDEEKLRMQQQQDKEMLKPQYEDVQVKSREGGRNIYNPEELYNLQQSLQHMSQFREGRGFSSPEVTDIAGKVSKDLSGVIKQAAGTSSVDEKIHAFNNIAENLGIDTQNLNMPGGVGEKAQVDAMQKLFKLINPENLDDQTLLNQEKLKYIYEQLQKIHPEMAEQFVQNAMKQAETKGLTKEFSKPYEPSGINWLFNVSRKLATRASYGTGYGLGQQAQKIGREIAPTIEAGQKVFQQYTPQSFQEAASKAATSSDATVQQFGQVLSKLATADERTRNSMVFVLQQQTGYRTMMNDLLPDEEKKSTQMKDNTVQKYK